MPVDGNISNGNIGIISEINQKQTEAFSGLKLFMIIHIIPQAII